jgi:hypothetical protein
MKVFYRIAESSNKEHENRRVNFQKLPNATKQRCLLNTLHSFPTAEFTIFVDNITESTWSWLQELEASNERVNLVKIHAGSESKSMRALLDASWNLTDDSEIVLFTEDDYLYLPGVEHKIIEVLKYAHYATGYLHPDKFWDPSRGGNPYTPMENVSEPTQVIKTSDHFWMITNSTTCTFAATVSVLKADKDIWLDGTSDPIGTSDFQTFLKLREKGRALVQPLPSLATHCLRGYEAPLVGLPINSWEEL